MIFLAGDVLENVEQRQEVLAERFTLTTIGLCKYYLVIGSFPN